MFTGGFIVLQGDYDKARSALASVSKDAKRGARQLTVTSTAKLKVGSTYVLTQSDQKKGKLAQYM